MRKLKLLTFFLFGGGLSLLMAQQPSLTQKKDLPVTLLQDKSITTSSVDIFKTTDITPPADGNYTLEVLTRVNHADGRGLDIETSDTGGKGFRASVNTQSLSWSNPLQSIESIITSGTIDQKLRFVVEDNNVHIYKNGYYITTRAKELVNVLIDGQEYDPFSSIANNGDQTNLISNAIPADYWWGGSKPTPQSHGWQLYNNGIYKDSWPNSRFENSPNTYALNNYSGNFFFVRWDSNNNNTDYYAYPVQLEANTTYLFSMDLAYWSNYNSSNPANISDKAVRVAISKDGGSTQELSNKTFYCYEAKDLIPDSFGFTTQEAGTYYLTFTGGWGMYAIANLNLIEATAEARIIVGKNYEGDADILIKSVTYDADGAFAPVPDGTMPQESLNLSDVNLSYLTFINTNISLSGKSELHLVSDSHPLQNSTVDLSGTEAWLYFDKVKPSDVIAGYLPLITIDKLPASQNNNIRVAQWGNGTVIIPYGNETMAAAMTVFDEENCQGNSQTFGINTYYNELNDWDNKIKSFILKKGYSATLANNASGTGYSRVFIASDEDLIVNVLPEGLVTKEGDTKSFVSFVRVFKWEWVGKKGWSGGVGMPSIMNPACSYDWNCDAYTGNPDVEYTPMRHNLGWPDFNHINRVNNVSHVLGFNEPDRDDQSDATVDETIMQWPDLFKSGLRIGSPAPSSVWTWIEGFMKTADSLNYRVDFMVAHIYEENLNASSWESRVRTLSNKGDGRPVWITEWNNGANWTNEYWPTASGPTCDAETNIIYDENGNTTTINRPLSPENAAKQLAFMEEILPAMDEMELLERHFFYNWVQDARAVELGGKLTPAGKFFANHKSKVGFSKAKEYVHEWKIAPPLPLLSLSSDYKKVHLEWYDHNGETGLNYQLERAKDSGNWEVVKVFTPNIDYNYGENVVFEEAIDCASKSDYRIIATSYKNTKSIYSRTVTVNRDATPAQPVLKGEAVSTTIIKLNWEETAGARAYRLERSSIPGGEFEILADQLSTTSYEDKDLEEAHSYSYRLYALSTALTDPVSETLIVSTRELTVPEISENVRAASGDSKVVITWDYAYDCIWRVLRSSDANGTYTEIASGLENNRFADDNVENSETYYYQVQPYNVKGDGPLSVIVEAKPAAGQFINIAFDENYGAIAYDTWGGYHAELKDGATWTEDGKKGSAVVLNRNDRSYLQFDEGVVSELEDFTIATWVKFDGGVGRLFDFGTGTGTFMMMAVTSSQLRYKIIVGETGAVYDVRVPCNVYKNEWMHLALTQKDDVIRFYQDGICFAEVINDQFVQPKDMGITNQNYLGRSQWSSDSYCDHIYDEFRIYNRALTAQEIVQLSEVAHYTIPVYYGSSIPQMIPVNESGTGLSVALKNNAIAVVDNEAITVSKDIANIIIKDATGYSCENLTLTDKSRFYTPVDFIAKSAIYTRDLNEYVYADGINGWNTLAVPFDGTLYADDEAKQPFSSDSDTSGQYWLKEFRGVNETEDMVGFDYASSIQANIPYIIALPGNRWGESNSMIGKEITVRAQDAAVSSDQARQTVSSHSFNGYYNEVIASGIRYHLTEQGDRFEMNMDDEILTPFYCYITLDVAPENAPMYLLIGSPQPTDIQLTQTKDAFNVYANDGKLFIETEVSGDIIIYNLQGMQIRSIKLNTGVNIIEDLTEGVYIVGTTKIKL